jgi:hypothetical protein
MRPRRAAGWVLAAALATWPVIGAAPAAAAPAPASGVARLQGVFLIAGRVTVAQRIRGEHRGQQVTRMWTFFPTCPTGACGTVVLTRTRSRGTDKVVLRRRTRDNYTGAGSFYAPLRCGSRTYSRGERVPFKITVRITAAAVAGGTVFATQLRASYDNRSRTNLTPCFAVLGHDSATYTGRLVAPAR